MDIPTTPIHKKKKKELWDMIHMKTTHAWRVLIHHMLLKQKTFSSAQGTKPKKQAFQAPWLKHTTVF
jgi:hypothetical protein